MSDQSPFLVLDGKTISPTLFTRGYCGEGGPCTCSAACCEGGVYADLQERDAILSHAALIRRHMDETQEGDERKWFESEEYDDPDFNSGRCVGTAVIGGKCAFLDGKGRCSIQVASTAEGLGRWALKPLYCVLYPLEISNAVVDYDPMLHGAHSCCTIGTPFDVPLFEACRAELEHLFTREGVQAMQDHFQRFYHSDRNSP